MDAILESAHGIVQAQKGNFKEEKVVERLHGGDCDRRERLKVHIFLCKAP
jgi:hypothetical protein